jgi:cyclophilin family peptidyl-prolyl cis-trans isomerase
MMLLASALTVFAGAGFMQVADAKPLSDHQLIALNKKPAPTNEPVVTMETSKGIIKMVIYKKDAPITAGNFLDLVQRGFYNGLIFHRHEPGFVIQGGDPQGNGTGGFIDPLTRTERQIPLEIKPQLRHSEAGMVAMARSGDPNSASSQFYITLSPSPKLDNNYAVFGKVIDGMPVVMNLRRGDKIMRADVKEPGAK